MIFRPLIVEQLLWGEGPQLTLDSGMSGPERVLVDVGGTAGGIYADTERLIVWTCDSHWAIILAISDLSERLLI